MGGVFWRQRRPAQDFFGIDTAEDERVATLHAVLMESSTHCHGCEASLPSWLRCAAPIVVNRPIRQLYFRSEADIQGCVFLLFLRTVRERPSTARRDFVLLCAIEQKLEFLSFNDEQACVDPCAASCAPARAVV